MQRFRVLWLSAAALVAVLQASCGGGGGSAGTPLGSSANTSAGTPTATGLADSAGTITAFGSVFVNGHEFSTSGAQVIDDDTASASTDASALEVGMAVTVKIASASTPSTPSASEIHIAPLARGFVDAADGSAATLTVMGQTVQLTASTNFSDHRACVAATSSPCAAVTGLAGLVATTGSGSTALPGNYVTVHGFLYSGAATIVATLVSVSDAPATSSAAAYKAEGVVATTAMNSITIGGLTVDLSGARCLAAGAVVSCASAFGSGQVVSVFAAAAPALPATTFTAGTALLRNRLPVQTVGASVELEGRVSSVASAPASFVIRGLSVDISALPAGSAPAVGDDVRVLGTVASGGTSISATSVTVLHAAASATFGLEGDFSAVAAGSGANTYTVTLLGQTLNVGAATRLADRSVRGHAAATSNPFNISTFQTYLTASASKHLVVRAQTDTSGVLQALSLTIVPAATAASVSGLVDATPAPVNSSTTGTPSTFSLHGLAVSADPAAFANGRGWWGKLTQTQVQAGDLVLVRGTYTGGQLVVTAPASGRSPSADNVVVDLGTPRGRDDSCF